MRGVSVYTPRRLSGSFISRPTETGLKLKKITNFQTVKNARNSNFSSSNCCGPMLTRTKATGLPAAVCRTSSLFEDRLHRHILQFLRTLVLFFVLLVGCEEWFYLPVGSLPYIRRVISCILFLLEQSRVVDLTVAEHHPDLVLESNVQNFEFSQLLLRRMNDSPKRFCHITLYAPLSIQFLTKTFCIRSRYAISQEWMSVFHAFLDELYATIL